MTQPVLSSGYHSLPPGTLANVVTCLEMTAKPKAARPGLPPGLALVGLNRADLAAYRALFRKIGADWLWFSRLMMPDAQLAAILAHANVESYALEKDGVAVGMLELDFRQVGTCELAFFGLARAAIGTGVGRALMGEAIAMAWAKPITRFWVHTCTYDHPAALGFYRRSGFRPYALMVEVHDDPRLTGALPEDAAPHVALIRS